jgi:hypothetical protein
MTVLRVELKPPHARLPRLLLMMAWTTTRLMGQSVMYPTAWTAFGSREVIVSSTQVRRVVVVVVVVVDMHDTGSIWMSRACMHVP